MLSELRVLEQARRLQCSAFPRGIAAIVAMLAAIGCAAAQPAPAPARAPIPAALRNGDYRELAVLIVGGELDFGNRRAIEDIFLQELLSKGYVLASRTDVDALVQEIGFQSSDLTAPEIARLGELLNVRALLLVSVPVTGQTSTMSARLVSVARGQVLWVDRVSSNVDIATVLVNLALLPIKILQGVASGPTGESETIGVARLAELLAAKVPAVGAG
jgi:hypothetical protein